MAFINQLVQMNNGEMISVNETSYSYEKFMDDMLLIETSINNLINNYCRIINECAIENILNEDSNLMVQDNTAKEEKEKLLTKLKEWWKRIVDAFFNMLDNIYNWAYEQIVLQKKFIDKHKDDIMRTTIIYGKSSSGTVLGKDGRKIDTAKDAFRAAEPDINTYEKILNPGWMDPMLSKSDLEKYIGEDNKIDGPALYKFYKDKVLGDMKNIDIDDINKSKSVLIKNIDTVYTEVKHRKSIIINMQKKDPPRDLTPEEIKEFQVLTMAQVQSLRAYNKVLLDYCKADVAILKKFIKSSDDTNKKEDKNNE